MISDLVFFEIFLGKGYFVVVCESVILKYFLEGKFIYKYFVERRIIYVIVIEFGYIVYSNGIIDIVICINEMG